MVYKTLNSQITTLLLCLLLIVIGSLSWAIRDTQASVSANVMYFVPQDMDKADKQMITPEMLRGVNLHENGFTSIQEIGFTSDWQLIDGLISSGELDALIVHHSAKEAVDWEAVKSLFQKERLIIAGIGIPGDELARRLGMPSLYNRMMLEGKDFDYFMYAIQITGQPSDVTKLLDTDLNEGQPPQNINAPASFQKASSHGYFSKEQEGITRFLGILDGLDF